MIKFEDREIEYFLYIIRCALKGEVPNKPEEPIDWERLVSIAKRQEVYSVIAAALPAEYLPAEQAERLNNYEKSELVRLIAMKNELAFLEAELCKSEIPFMLLKGSRIRAFYPKESMRQMSDIDILYNEKGRDSLLKIMKKRGYKLSSWSENSDDFIKAPYYTFEFHRTLFFDDFNFNTDFSFVWENAKRDGENEFKYIMSDEDLYIHSVAHMYKHHVLGGFGVRFLTDTYLMVKKCADMDFGYINGRMEEMGLADFESLVRNLSVALIEDGDLSGEQLDFLVTVLSFGLYGDSAKGRLVQYETFKNNNGGSSSMVKYTLLRLFPPKEYMCRTYRVLNKAPVLLPFFYVYRLIVKTAKDGKRAVKEIVEIRQIQKNDKKEK